ncbi:uncharacterized protein N7483_002863 [Penicillium malachiteum]|uniref:uncharacterized protein n=1 Tax=Penicillium malachiteum TaxID=1324776 RepID=UPI002546E005|nr:uncharacterized protein N7483_002863 [Penicillium malachiteum]KAJ5737738.1 hypothetical protein N7483_002863 [Penicillium malachiteum]
MFGWLTRCLPGFSILALIFLLICAFSNLMSSRAWRDIFPPWVSQPLHEGWWIGLNMAQIIFVIYAMLIHFQMFAFTLRLGWSMLRVTAKTREALGRRPTPKRAVSVSSASSSSSSPCPTLDEGYESQSLSPVSLPSPNPFSEKLYSITGSKVEEDELIHAIILPNYSEDLHTLETTLNVLASHPRARSQYEVSA